MRKWHELVFKSGQIYYNIDVVQQQRTKVFAKVSQPKLISRLRTSYAKFHNQRCREPDWN